MMMMMMMMMIDDDDMQLSFINTALFNLSI